jgi:hypothetical protein
MLSIVILSVSVMIIMLNAVMPHVDMLDVVMPSVVEPLQGWHSQSFDGNCLGRGALSQTYEDFLSQPLVSKAPLQNYSKITVRSFVSK